MAHTYRRRRGHDAWHFCSNCRKWPTVDYVEQSTKPTTGEFCDECRAKRDNGNCT